MAKRKVWGPGEGNVSSLSPAVKVQGNRRMSLASITFDFIKGGEFVYKLDTCILPTEPVLKHSEVTTAAGTCEDEGWNGRL